MHNHYRFIIFYCLLTVNVSHAEFKPYIEGLYWRATETVDWALNNNLNASNQQVTYLTGEYEYKPGFRLGLAYQGNWDANFWYTRYKTNTEDAATGNLTSAFIGGKLAQSNPNFFYQSGQFASSIHLDMIDLDVGKRFRTTEKLIIHPKLGIQAAQINQTFDTRFQGQRSVVENISNDFKGIGPKAGIDFEYLLKQRKQTYASLIADFSLSFLAGRWKVSDELTANNQAQVITNISNHHFVAVNVHSSVGAKVGAKQFSVKLMYELNDYFNQCQIFDDATGPHSNDLILQGITAEVSWRFDD